MGHVGSVWVMLGQFGSELVSLDHVGSIGVKQGLGNAEYVWVMLSLCESLVSMELVWFVWVILSHA